MHLLSSVNFVHVCVQVWQTCSSRLEIKTLCGTWLMIRWELKQKADESSEKREIGRGGGGKGKWCEQYEKMPVVCEGKGLGIAFAAVLRLVSRLLFYQDVRQTFPIGSLLSAVSQNVTQLGKLVTRNMWGTPRRAAVMSCRCAQGRMCANSNTLKRTRFSCPLSSHHENTESHPRAKIVTNRYHVSCPVCLCCAMIYIFDNLHESTSRGFKPQVWQSNLYRAIKWSESCYYNWEWPDL